MILRQISLGVPTVRRRSFSLSYEKILQKSRFWVFSEMLRQISLGVHSYAVVHFPCLTKKSFKNRESRFLGLCRNARSNVTRSTDSTPSFIFLVLRKNPSKIETLGLFGYTATNITRSTFVRRRSFSLSYEKILQKSRFGSFRRYCDKYHSEYIRMLSFIFRQNDQVCNALYI